MTTPCNQGKPWSYTTISACVGAWLACEFSVAEIASALGRTELAIRYQLAEKVYMNQIPPELIKPYYSQMPKCFEKYLGYEEYIPATPTPIVEETKMPFSIKVEKRTFVNGRDVEQLSDTDLLTLIQQAEKELQEIDSFEAKPKVLTACKEDLQKGIMLIVNILDARFRSSKS